MKERNIWKEIKKKSKIRKKEQMAYAIYKK